MGYRDEVLRDRPLGYWRMKETSGTAVADETGSGIPASWAGTPTLNQAGALLDDASPSVTLSGDDYISVTDSVRRLFAARVIPPIASRVFA
jgi:hypothetical protein